MDKSTLWAAFAFAMFIACPRMAGMLWLISRHTQAAILPTIIIGAILSLPILLLMTWAFKQWGVYGALFVCILTDFGSAIVMGKVSIKAGAETLIIAIFVILGVKVAPIICQVFGIH